MKFFLVHGHLDKCQPYIDALADRGHTRVGDPARVDFGLYDFMRSGQRRIFAEMHKNKTPMFIYPHAALSAYIWDGLVSSEIPAACNFTYGEGQRQIMAAYGYPHPTMAVGWPYGPIEPFRPRQAVQRILFAPKHPNGKRALIDQDQALNREVFQRLRTAGAELTVYYGHDLENNGLERVPGIQYIPSTLNLDGAVQQIRQADLVVAHDTFAYLSIAQGVPTLMFTGNQTPHVIGKPVKNWKSYRHIAKYPLDILDVTAKKAPALIERAASTDEDIHDWKERMIGQPFCGDRFVDAIEERANLRPSTPLPREDLWAYWRKPPAPNKPSSYLSDERNGRSQFLVDWVDRLHLPKDAPLLELGCNAGRNLSHLWRQGYRDLSAIEINPQAVDLLHATFLEMEVKILVGTIEEHIDQLPRYSLIFTVAVLVHLHPSSAWIFQKMAERTKYLITIEDEATNHGRHIARNYRRIFEGLGMKQVLYQRSVPGMNQAYVARMFTHE